jgi:hypothetical protein
MQVYHLATLIHILLGLQTFFFTTILSMDIGQMELSDVMQKMPSPQKDGRLFHQPVNSRFTNH